MRVAAAGTLLVVAFLAACGGKVTWVPDSGSGGSGAQGSSSSTSKATTSAIMATTATGTQGFCQSFCMQTGDCIFPDQCISQCENITAPPCTGEGENLLSCFQGAIDPNDCSFFGGCDVETAKFNECTGASGCSSGTCSITPDSCSCAGVCNGQNVHSICTVFSNDLADCTCFVEATPVGSCKETNGNNCSLEVGCCAAILQGEL